MEAAFDEVEILQKVARMSKDPEWMKSLQHYYAGVRTVLHNCQQALSTQSIGIYK